MNTNDIEIDCVNCGDLLTYDRRSHVGHCESCGFEEVFEDHSALGAGPTPQQEWDEYQSDRLAVYRAEY